MYWDEISALCVDGESLRLQKLLLRKLLNRQHRLQTSGTSLREDALTLQETKDKMEEVYSLIAMLEDKQSVW